MTIATSTSAAIRAKLPDLARSFAKMKLVDDLLLATKQDTVVGCIIIEAILNKVPAEKVIAMVKKEISEGPATMETIIGEDMINKIKQW